MTTKIFGLYDGLLAVIDFIVSRTSDTLADLMIKALPLVAPIPNAVSIYYISQSVLNYTPLQAFAVAASLECMFFALTEVALKLWDGSQEDERYRAPLKVAGILFGVFFALVMVLVAVLEVPHNSYAPLAFPVVSVVAALTLGCERWHRRNVQNRLNEKRNQSDQLRTDSDELRTQLDAIQAQLDAERAKSDRLRTQLDAERTQLGAERAQLNDMRREFDTFAPESILARLDEGKRQKLSELLALVESQRIQSPGDLIKHGMQKADVYGLWPVAMAARLIYPNGDDSYHARK